MSNLAIIQLMSNFTERLESHLAKINKTPYWLWKESKLSQTVVYNVVSGKRTPTDEVLKAFAGVEGLGLDYETLVSWRVVDEYPKGVLLKACKQLKT